MERERERERARERKSKTKTEREQRGAERQPAFVYFSPAWLVSLRLVH